MLVPALLLGLLLPVRVPANSPPGSDRGSALPRVYRMGDDLAASGQRFQAWGFNYGVGDRYAILRYFDRPTAARLNQVTADMREARALGANTLRVYLELKSFMRPPGEPRPRTLEGLAALLEKAERLRLYLDITGNLVWRRPPAWYDALSERARWRVQARFWRAVARTAHDSPAVLVYELTSEPVIVRSGAWYGGEFGGYTFAQNIVRDLGGRDPQVLARRWIRLLRSSIRRYDDRHLIGIGLLPHLDGPFGPSNVADLLDVLLVHEYPVSGDADWSVTVVHRFAREGVPVVLGETAPIWCDLGTQETFLRGVRHVLDGYLSFYDGRTPSEVGDTIGDALYAVSLEHFIGLRPDLVGH